MPSKLADIKCKLQKTNNFETDLLGFLAAGISSQNDTINMTARWWKIDLIY